MGFLVTTIYGKLQAQTVITGTVLDPRGKGVADAYVTVSAKEESSILGYATQMARELIAWNSKANPTPLW